MSVIDLDSIDITASDKRREVTLYPRPQRRPDWIKVRAPAAKTYDNVKTLMRSKQLHRMRRGELPQYRRMLGRKGQRPF